MRTDIRKWLLGQQEKIKFEFALAGITPQQFAHFDGDKEYAEVEIVEALEICGVWNGYSDYDNIVSHSIFQKTIRWQASYNIYA